MSGEYDSELISIVAHDLKTPIVATRGFIELVEYSGELNERQQYYIQRAYAALHRMEQLIVGILDFARIASGGATLDLGLVDIRQLIVESYEFLNDIAQQQQVTLHLELGEDTPVEVPADKNLLRHLINNLISNAIKYNRKEGHVWVTLQAGPQAVRVDVRDTGIGIDKKDQSRIFDQFERVVKQTQDGEKIEGTGLGLAICQAVVQMHGGKIWVESTPNQGSTFSFILPIQVSPSEHLNSVKRRGFAMFDKIHSGEVSDDVDDDLQERPENPDRESRMDKL